MTAFHNALPARSTGTCIILATVLSVSVAAVTGLGTGSGYGHGSPSVLPAAPGDVPATCTDPGSSCGPDRYCALDPSSPDPSSSSSSDEYYCLHKALAQNPISARDVLALTMVSLCCFLAAMGGIGGGGLLFPLIVMICNFTPKEAIVLSHAGVFGNCLGQAAFYVGSAVAASDPRARRRRRRRRRGQHGDGGDGRDGGGISGGNVSDDSGSSSQNLYQSVAAAVLVILPGLLAGGSAAITLQGLVPSTAILILALVTLTLGVVKTTIKACKMWKDEEDVALGQAEVVAAANDTGNDNGDHTDFAQDACTRSGSEDDESDLDRHAFDYKAMDSGGLDTSRLDVRAGSGYGTGETNADAAANNSDIDIMSQPLEVGQPLNSGQILASGGCCHHGDVFRCTVERLILSCWALDAATFLAQRSSSISKCSAAYFVVVFLPVLFGLFFVWRGRALLVHRRCVDGERRHESHGGMQSETTDTWEDNAQAVENVRPNQSKSFDVLVWWLPLVSFVVGLISALLGIGGGEILGPTLLLLKMNPQHSSTTTSVVALLNSGTNTLHNATAGLIISPAYFVCLWSLGLVAGGAGRAFSMIVSARSGKNSIIAFSLAVLLAFAAALVATELLIAPPSWSSEGVC